MGILDLFKKKKTEPIYEECSPTIQPKIEQSKEPEQLEETHALDTTRVTEYQTKQIIDYIAREKANYDDCLGGDDFGDVNMGRLDPLFETAAHLIVIHQQGSTSLIQRKFAIGYNRAGRIMEQLERAGIVGCMQGANARDVLCKDENDLENCLNNLDITPFSSKGAISNMSKEEYTIFKNEHAEDIQKRTEEYELIIEEREKEIMRQEIEFEKERIKEEMAKKRRARDIRAAAMKELVDEGILDSDYIKKRESIPQEIQDAVWNRDGGRCVKCGSQENLEFDHIIPFSKGGSNTIRNLQLLCKKCNLNKSNKIG